MSFFLLSILIYAVTAKSIITKDQKDQQDQCEIPSIFSYLTNTEVTDITDITDIGSNKEKADDLYLLEFKPSLNSVYTQDLRGVLNFFLDLEFNNVLPNNGSFSVDLNLLTEFKDDKKSKEKYSINTENTQTSTSMSRTSPLRLNSVPMFLKPLALKLIGIANYEVLFKLDSANLAESVPKEKINDFRHFLKIFLNEFGPYHRLRTGKAVESLRTFDENHHTPLLGPLVYSTHSVKVGSVWKESFQDTIKSNDSDYSDSDSNSDNNNSSDDDESIAVSGEHEFTLNRVYVDDNDIMLAEIVGVTTIDIALNLDLEDLGISTKSFNHRLIIDSTFTVDMNTGVPIKWSLSSLSDWYVEKIGSLRIDFELSSDNRLLKYKCGL